MSPKKKKTAKKPVAKKKSASKAGGSSRLSKKAVLTASAPAPIGPYSQAIRVGDWLYCSGQIPLDPKTAQVVPGNVSAQAEQVLKNMGEVLRAGGASFDSVVKTTIFLKSMGDFPQVNEVYGRFFQGTTPARSTVEVARLPRDVLVEIEAIALCR